MLRFPSHTEYFMGRTEIAQAATFIPPLCAALWTRAQSQNQPIYHVFLKYSSSSLLSFFSPGSLLNQLAASNLPSFCQPQKIFKNRLLGWRLSPGEPPHGTHWHGVWARKCTPLQPVALI